MPDLGARFGQAAAQVQPSRVGRPVSTTATSGAARTIASSARAPSCSVPTIVRPAWRRMRAEQHGLLELIADGEEDGDRGHVFQ